MLSESATCLNCKERWNKNDLSSFCAHNIYQTEIILIEQRESKPESPPSLVLLYYYIIYFFFLLQKTKNKIQKYI